MRRKINKKRRTIITLFLSIISLFVLSTIAYSAFSSTMNITGFAHARVEADVRITDFKIASANNAISLYEEFGKNNINSNINLQTTQSTITYYVEITNYGTTDVGIYNITGLPTGVNYQIKDYNLKDKICDETGKCNSFIKKTFELTLSTTSNSFEGNIDLEFDIRPFHKITYVNFNNTYKQEFISGEEFIIDLSQEQRNFVGVASSEPINYNYSNYILTVYEATANIVLTAVIDEVKNYSYTGDIQNFTAPIDGIYKLEVWGASGGDCSIESADDMTKLKMYGGNGGYSSGYVKLKQNETVYVVVGGEGEGTTKQHAELKGGYNGGGNCYANETVNHVYGAGGGATHIATKTGILSTLYNYQDKIFIVAGGGGGSRNQWNNYNSGARYGNGGAGGGLNGIAAIGYGGDGKIHTRTKIYGTQSGEAEYFGRGVSYKSGGAGGGGFYGGYSGEYYDNVYPGAGDGGSGYIGGVQEGFTIAGNEYIPTHDGTTTMLGNDGNGYAKITIVSDRAEEYTITYEGFTGTYQTSIYSGRTLNLDLSGENTEGLQVYINGTKTNNYTFINNKLQIPNVTGNLKITTVYTKYLSNLQSYYPLKSDINDHSTIKYYGDLVTMDASTPSFDDDGINITTTGLRSKTNNLSLPDQFTAIIDFKPSSIETNYHHIWGIWQGVQGYSNYNSLSHYETGVQIQNGNTTITIPDILTDTNKWYRFIVVGTSSNWSLYLDGTHIYTMESTYKKKTSYLYVGENTNEYLDDGEPTINGHLQNFRIYNTTMTQDDIVSLKGKDKPIVKYSITYNGLSGNYPTSITSGDNLILDLSNEEYEGIDVYINGTRTNNYTYQDDTLTIKNITGNVEIKTLYAKYQSNLQSYYPFTTDSNDYSTIKLFGDLTSTATYTYSNDGIYIENTGLRTTTNNKTLPNKFTIIIDYKPTTSDSTFHHIWGIWQGENNSQSYNSLAQYGNKYQIQNGTSAKETINSPLQIDKWHRLIVVNDATKWQLYLDGNFLIELSSSTIHKTGYFYVGQNFHATLAADGEPSINGHLKDLRIYDIAMTKEEIAMLKTKKE